ncbi:MAG TPA: flagellar FliJ family protein [Candidatus Cybelea sp.]|nr:flagellar FliJ family protein [Candidatus Cybelea sp.]
MKAMHTLIRLYRRQLDDKRRNLNDLERMKAEFEGQVRRLDEEIAAEQKCADSEETRFAYGTYAEAAARRRITLAKSIGDLDSQIKAAREEVAVAFQEVKKFEILHDQRQRRTRQQAERREQIAQDETSIQTYRRLQGGD